MPVYNGEAYLREAIDSIVNQTYTDFEFLIINDGSTDGTESIILSYADARIRYEKNETNLKLIATLNKGIELAKGKYIVRMDADDISAPDRIEKQVAFMEANPQVGLCGTWFESFGDEIKYVSRYKEKHDEIVFKMLYQCHFCHPTLIIRKAVFKDLEIPFDKNFIHAEDYEFYFRISEKWKLYNLQESLLKYRIHNQSVSRQNEKVQKANALRVRKKFFLQLSTNCSEEELEAFKELNYQNYDRIVLTPEQVKNMLESLLLGNRKVHYINISYFEQQLKTLWLNYCYHKSSLRTYRTSRLLFEQNLLKTVSKPKWFLKSLLHS